MKDLYILLVPFSIAIFGLAIHYCWKYLVWRKECKRDEKSRKEFDRLLSDDPGCENEEILHPKKWDANVYCPN